MCVEEAKHTLRIQNVLVRILCPRIRLTNVNVNFVDSLVYVNSARSIIHLPKNITITVKLSYSESFNKKKVFVTT